MHKERARIKPIFLSHILNGDTPSYGNKSKLSLTLNKSLAHNDSCNESILMLPMHLGTHIDLPLHFHQNGQSLNSFSTDFWIFNNPLYVKITPLSLIIYQEIIDALKNIPSDQLQQCDILLINTGIGEKRGTTEFWMGNPGFSPDLYDFFKCKLPALRIAGFDSISLSSFQHRDIGKKAHLKFLNPESPILLIEDMKLDELLITDELRKVIVSPLRVANCDGLPVTALGWV